MKLKIKDCYRIGDLVSDEFGTKGIVVYVSRNKIIVKNEYSSATYTEIVDLNSFKKELTVLAHIGTLISSTISILEDAH